ncbi:MAG: flagellar hook-basal body complex protein FliE [Zoogloeaceae bacterium]|uniref:flagellar hook-basal body complex protein FliE n=1 Tax=Denitromonas sp. TaxID=2734609 RepID=UPI001D2FDD45|nr:flagellar hook-basal body complex protein FliE [Rhodocyclaceae bacterium]MCP5222922.1 flagellar hook-basal body complex protein FliE [Zoogloeaceae bacterium]HPR05139.1 flagellar hook-basal body complex protein FliE [Denitromonas sp.]
MDSRGIDQVLNELRATAQTAGGKSASAATETPEGVSFNDALQNALADVSAAQQDAQTMAKSFSAGDPNVNLQEVMVNLQKANLSFQQMTQVRNRLVSAYQDIMNMQV